MSTENTAGCSCLAYLIGLAIFSLPGALSINYLTNTIICKNIPWYADWIAGFFLSGFSIPFAIVVWILQMCGIDCSWLCQ